MKVRKTRIKKQTKANGSVVYSAQYKYGFWWADFNDLYASHKMWRFFYDWVTLQDDVTWTEKQAKDLIDYYIRKVKHEQSSKIENKVIKTEYEGYP